MAQRKFKVMGTIEMNFETYVLADDEEEAWEEGEELAKEGCDVTFTEPVGEGEIHHVEEIK